MPDVTKINVERTVVGGFVDGIVGGGLGVSVIDEFVVVSWLVGPLVEVKVGELVDGLVGGLEGGLVGWSVEA